MALTVAVTGPTGEIGLPLMAELEGDPAVGVVRGMARRPFDPVAEGWEKASYRRGDILDRGSLAALFDGADVAVHLAFAIFGGREETRRINLEGSRNVFEAAIEAGVKRLVYASSVAAYGFHPENPQPLTEAVPARGSESFYYSAQKAELESTLDELLVGTEVDAYVFRPCIVAGPRATMLIEKAVEGARLGDPLPALRKGLRRLPLPKPLLPDIGAPLQLVHHDDVARALAAAIAGKGESGAYNLAGAGLLGVGDVARALGWHTVPIPTVAVGLSAAVAKRLSFISPQLEWAAALRVPVLMDTTKARRELDWEPRFDARETLIQTAVSAREAGLLE
ncbi:MAG TPA: NAD-dependent epimerase/dehydratase family protein [Solirubrobacterales bacterium]|nr:NAD-dependent epimerase/dehydratase family protein [Solirubrobacterales bacterium]